MTELTKETRAVTVAEPPLVLPDNLATTGGGILGIAASAVVAFFVIRAKWSKSNLDVAQNKSAEDIIKTLQQQLDKAHTDRNHFQEVAANAWRTRADDAKLIGELTAKVEHLTNVNAELKLTVSTLIEKVDKMEAIVEIHDIKVVPDKPPTS